jgi:hypothetical protein
LSLSGSWADAKAIAMNHDAAIAIGNAIDDRSLLITSSFIILSS